MSQAVGVVGLGLMGRHMAANLARAGFAVHAWNRTRRPELETLGLHLADTPAEVGAAADVVISMVTDAAALDYVTVGADGFYATLGGRPQALHISMETIGGEATQSKARQAAAQAITLLAAPVSGGSGGAQAGTLAIMASGDRAAFTRAEPLFDAMGDPAKRAWCGPDVGQAPDLKLDNNLCLLDGLVTMFLSCIGVRQSGIDPATAYRVLLSSTGDSVAMRGRCWLPGVAPGNPVDHGFAPGYKLKDSLKDLRLWALKAERGGLPRGRISATIDLYEEAVRRGWGELDCSAILNLLLERTGLPLLPTALDAVTAGLPAATPR